MCWEKETGTAIRAWGMRLVTKRGKTRYFKILIKEVENFMDWEGFFEGLLRIWEVFRLKNQLENMNGLMHLHVLKTFNHVREKIKSFNKKK